MNKTKLYKSSLLFICLLNLFLSKAYTQNNNIEFYSLKVNQGLSQAAINSIVRDSMGFMWFGTLDGLNRFDGNEVIVYRQKSDTTGLYSNEITDLKIDNKGKLWVVTRKGINIYNPQKDIFERVDIPALQNGGKIKQVEFSASNNQAYILGEKQIVIYNIGKQKSTVLKNLSYSNNTSITLYKDTFFFSNKRNIFLLTPQMQLKKFLHFNETFIKILQISAD